MSRQGRGGAGKSEQTRAQHSAPAHLSGMHDSLTGRGGDSATDASAIDRAAHVQHAVQGQIIPRLLRAQQSRDHLREQDVAGHGDTSVLPRVFTQADVDAFAHLLIAYAPYVAQRFIDSQLALGHSSIDLLLDLCSPAARTLGAMWARDECSFCDVTIGLSTLEQILIQGAGPADGMPTEDGRDRTILLTPMPGNQHVFGSLVVKEVFRKAGWTVRTPARPDQASLLDALRSTRFSAMGLSVASPEDLQACRALVKICRQESLNKKLMVLVGGNAIAEPSLSTRLLDADLIVRDAREGLVQVERLIARISPQRPFN